MPFLFFLDKFQQLWFDKINKRKGDIDMLLSIIESIISIFIMYKCCEKFEYKVTWAIYTGIYVLFAVIQNGFSVFFMALIMYAILSAIIVWIYYKIYERSSNSFWKFFGLCLLVQVVVILVISLLAGIIIYSTASNGILSSAM